MRQHRKAHPESDKPFRLIFLLSILVLCMVMRLIVAGCLESRNLHLKGQLMNSELTIAIPTLESSYVFPGHQSLFYDDIDGILFYVVVMLVSDCLPLAILLLLWIALFLDVGKVMKKIKSSTKDSSGSEYEKIIDDEEEEEEEESDLYKIPQRYSDY